MVQGPRVSRASECKTHKEATNRTKRSIEIAGLGFFFLADMCVWTPRAIERGRSIVRMSKRF